VGVLQQGWPHALTLWCSVLSVLRDTLARREGFSASTKGALACLASQLTGTQGQSVGVVTWDVLSWG
jgi:hypothetical protein